MVNTVCYKQFYITFKVELERWPTNRYQISDQTRRVEDEIEQEAMRSWLTCNEFANQKAAYEFGLQEAGTWIDEHG